jgi:hypothetical protein
VGQRSGDLAIVGAGIQVDDFETLLDELDGGDEGLALDAVDVELVGVTTGAA